MDAFLKLPDHQEESGQKENVRKVLLSKKDVNPGESNKCPHVGIISIHAAPYRDATFATLHHRGVIDITVITLLDSDPGHRFWDCDQIDFPNITLKKCYGKFRRWFFHPQILRVLRKERFDVIIIPGTQYLTNWQAITYCLITKTPFIFATDKVRDRNTSGIREALGSRVMSWVLRQASAFWVPGKASRKHFVGKGINEDRIFEGCYNLDCTAIAAQLSHHKGKRLELRRRLSIAEDGFVFLMVANVLPNRRHDLLLESFCRVEDKYPNSYLLLVGIGADQETVIRLSKNQRAKNIRAIGPVGFNDLAPLFAASDVYVHSGTESYSTAVEYAAIAGLPIVTTPHVGAAKDYVINGETGYVVSSEDVSGFAERMLLLARDRDAAQRYGRRAGELASEFTSEWAAEQLEKAVAMAYGHDHDQDRRIAKKA